MTLFPNLTAEHIGMLQLSGPACVSVIYVTVWSNGFSHCVWVSYMRWAVRPFPLLMGAPGAGNVCLCFWVYVNKRMKKEVGNPR